MTKIMNIETLVTGTPQYLLNLIKIRYPNATRTNSVAFTDRRLVHPRSRRLRASAFHPSVSSPWLSLEAVMAEEVDDTDVMMNYHGDFLKSDRKNSRYPYCVVWTPIPILS